MTVTTITASWGADVQGSTKYPNDGSDYCGGSGTDIYRVANKFPYTSGLDAIPSTAQISLVEILINVSSVTSASSLLWDLRPYGSNGQDNPESDSAATMYASCAPGNPGNYVTESTAFRTTGLKTITLGGSVATHILAAISATTPFSIGFAETLSSSANERCEFSEYTDGTNPPKLRVTWSLSAGMPALLNNMNGGVL